MALSTTALAYDDAEVRLAMRRLSFWNRRHFFIAVFMLLAQVGWPQNAFRIASVRPIPELRAEALAAQPPQEKGEFLAPALADLAQADPRIHFEIRYATGNNFLGTPVYSSARAFMQRPAAEALRRALHDLSRQGYGLLVFDAYRPWYVTKIFWEAVPPAQHWFVADPAKGSRHNRGCAVDLTLYDLATGKRVAMPSGYDEISERAHPSYAGGTAKERAHRELLRRAMERQGFTVNPDEWWHFDYKDWPRYAIQNVPFEQLH
jgi:D-alanyl-D-alanine dipeptidase